MQSMRKISMVVLLILITQSLCAEKKERIRVTNNYGDDVVLHLTWRSESFMGSTYLKSLNPDRSQDIMLKEHHVDYEFAAPVSTYNLFEITATPAINAAAPAQQSAKASSGWDPLVGDQGSDTSRNYFDEPSSSPVYDKLLNTDGIKVKNQKFFVIETTHKPSGIPGQDKIKVHEYSSEAAYKQAIAKLQPTAMQAPIALSAPQLNRDFINHYYGE